MMKTFVAAFAALLVTSTAGAAGLVRYPDVHEDKIVFTHGGDLWLVSTKGGTARRLTAHPGIELFAKFSPDGATIAFTGQYEGDEQVYVIPTAGGAPEQLTFYPARGPLPARWGFDHQVYGWTPDGKQVLFRGLRDHWTVSAGRLYTVPASGGAPTALAPPVAGAGDLSNDGRLLYSPLFRDFRTWKRYQGGWAQDLYIWDLAASTLERVTDHPRADRDPMWIGDAVFFASDRDGRLNLYRYDVSTKKTSQLTKHSKADVRWPSAGPNGAIVYELDGALRIFDTKSKRDSAVAVDIPGEGLASRPRDVDVGGAIESFAASPSGKRALITARGDVFDVPTEHGVTKNLTHSSNAHEREPAWSPDGKRAVFVSDVSGEEALWLYEFASAEHTQLTFEKASRLYGPRWSSDSSRIAYADHAGRLFVVDVKSRRSRQVVDDAAAMNDYAWSPGGGYLAYATTQPWGGHVVHVYDAATGKSHRVTGEIFNAFAPAWGPKGEYLYYLSDRDFHPQFGSFDYNYIGDRETGIYGVALRAGLKHPFAPKNDDAVPEKKEEKKDDKKKEDRSKAPVVEFEGIEDRVFHVPIATSNYRSFFVTEKHFVALDAGPSFLGRDDVEPKLVAFEIEEEKLETLASGVRGYDVAHDKSRVIIRTQKGLSVLELGKKDADAKSISTKGMTARVIPKQEWMTIFDEVWRRFRDHFYVADLGGHDWDALRERYRPLAASVAHREELNDVLGQMVAELEVSHAYIADGDLGLPDRPSVGLLGARFELDAKSGRHRVQKIFVGHNEEPTYRSPLTQVGVNVAVGDYVLAINGQSLRADDNPFRLLRGTVGKSVELLVNSRPVDEGARRVVVEPIGSEASLVYLEWVLERRDRVDAATDGKIGYLHLPNMGLDGLREFTKWFYPQIRKEGLIVDVRANGGGFVSQLIIERLRRQVLGTGFGRNREHVETYPYAVMAGPMVCVMDETSGSDGDIFPWAFRAAELGPLIGKRTWGGVVGITDHGPLLDGGSVFVPEFSTNGPDGAYIIEGEGVAPDIVVDNDPLAVAQGKDPQLERAIAEVLARHAKSTKLPKKPVRAPKR